MAPSYRAAPYDVPCSNISDAYVHELLHQPPLLDGLTQRSGGPANVHMATFVGKQPAVCCTRVNVIDLCAQRGVRVSAGDFGNSHSLLGE